MPKEVEDKLRRQAVARRLKGKRADRYVYGTMNKLGLMHGNKTDYSKTSKSAALKSIGEKSHGEDKKDKK